MSAGCRCEHVSEKFAPISRLEPRKLNTMPCFLLEKKFSLQFPLWWGKELAAVVNCRVRDKTVVLKIFLSLIAFVSNQMLVRSQ